MTPIREATTAVVLARGLGSRMRQDDPGASLDDAQRDLAERGVKPMIPDSRGRPFLDHVLASLADAGVVRAVLVVGPDPRPFSTHYLASPPRRITITWMVQEEPRGTAHAVLSARDAVGDGDFLVLNADNLYPVAAIRALVHLGRPGLVVFPRATLLAESNIAPERVGAFAIARVGAYGRLEGLIEKPGSYDPAAVSDTSLVSMNLWRFDSGIFAACRDVPLSARGEYELPEAVALAVSQGSHFHAVESREGVLDLSRRGDIPRVAGILGTRDVSL